DRESIFPAEQHDDSLVSLTRHMNPAAHRRAITRHKPINTTQTQLLPSFRPSSSLEMNISHFGHRWWSSVMAAPQCGQGISAASPGRNSSAGDQSASGSYSPSAAP